MARTTIVIDDDVRDEIENHPEYDNNLSKWLEEAARQRLDQPTTEQRVRQLEQRLTAVENNQRSIWEKGRDAVKSLSGGDPDVEID